MAQSVEKLETAEKFAECFVNDVLNPKTIHEQLCSFEAQLGDLKIEVKSKYDDDDENDQSVTPAENLDHKQTNGNVDNEEEFKVHHVATSELLVEEEEMRDSNDANAIQASGEAETDNTVSTDANAMDSTEAENSAAPGVDEEKTVTGTTMEIVDDQSTPKIYVENCSATPTEEKSEEIPTESPVVAAVPEVPSTEEDKFEEKMKQLGIGDHLWNSKRSEVESQLKQNAKVVDKFQSMRQKIKKGNTRSLKERFESLKKL